MKIKKKTLTEIFSLIGSFFIAAFLFCLPMSDLEFFHKFTRPFAIFDIDQLGNHEIFLKSPIGKKRSKIIAMGSCQFESYWCTETKKFYECSIPSLLEQEFFKNHYENVRVANLGFPGMAGGLNLNLFLHFLERPDVRYFIWNEEFSFKSGILSRGNIKELKMFIPYIYRKLQSLSEIHPQLIEAKKMLGYIKKNIPDVEEIKINDYLHGGFEKKSIDFKTQLAINLKLLVKHSFLLELSVLENILKTNTSYLRRIRARLPSLFAISYKNDFFDSFKDDLENSPPFVHNPFQWKRDRFDITLDGQGQENIIDSLQLMGKLAELYDKELYIYFDPSGACQTDQVYDRVYKNPIKEAMKEFSRVHIIDATTVGLIPGRDTFNCRQLTYFGNEKVAKFIYDKIENKEEFQ